MHHARSANVIKSRLPSHCRMWNELKIVLCRASIACRVEWKPRGKSIISEAQKSRLSEEEFHDAQIKSTVVTE